MASLAVDDDELPPLPEDDWTTRKKRKKEQSREEANELEMLRKQIYTINPNWEELNQEDILG